MRLKFAVLCSSSLAMLAIASPALSQTTTDTAPVQTESIPNDPDAAAPQQDDAVEGEGEEIVVTGLRRSLQSAQNIKRNSDQIVDVVVAEDIGKLPDVNVSDSLARVTGVQINRENGEGTGVSVRGLPDVTTTYNGRDIFTAEARFVATQDFPAGGVAALEVFKSTTAEQIEGGIAGLVNVRSRRPFDFSGLEIAGSLNGIYTDQAKGKDGNGNLLISNRWDVGGGEIGALINVSYTRLSYLDSIRFNSGDIGTANANQSTAGAFRFPRSVGLFANQGERSRPSVNASLQWRPSDSFEVYVDALFQGFRRRRTDRLFDVSLRGDPTRFTNVVLVPGTNQAQSLTATTVDRIFRFQGATYDKTNTYQYAVGAIYKGERFKLSADLARTTSRFDLSVASFDSFGRTPPVVDVNFDVPRGDGGVEFSFRNFNTNDPASYEFGGLFEREFYAKGDDYQFRSDLEFETGIDILPRLMAGVRYVDRNGSTGNGQRFTPGGGPLTNLPIRIVTTPRGFRGDDIQPTRTFATPSYESIRSPQLRAAIGAPASDPEARQDFEVNERAYTGYAQLAYNFDFGGLGVDGLAGIRVVQTESKFLEESRSSYTDYLPNVSARVRLADRLQLRAAFTQTRTRPGFNQTGPTILNPQNPNEPFRTGGGGNPDLNPVESDNYDVSLEYYFSRTGFAALAGFRRDVDGFITNLNRTINDPVLGELRLNRPENGGSGRLEGFEAQVTTFFDFDFVPDFLQGFGVQANYTFIDASQAFPSVFGGDPSASFAIPQVSRHTYNLVGLYESGKVSARLAYNHRTRFVTGFDNAQAGVLSGEFTAGVSRLDFSASYTPIENITLAFDVSNILGQPFRNFRNYTNEGDIFPRDVRFEERVYSLGIRFRI